MKDTLIDVASSLFHLCFISIFHSAARPCVFSRKQLYCNGRTNSLNRRREWKWRKWSKLMCVDRISFAFSSLFHLFFPRCSNSTALLIKTILHLLSTTDYCICYLLLIAYYCITSSTNFCWYHITVLLYLLISADSILLYYFIY